MTKAQSRKYRDKLEYFLCMKGLTIKKFIGVGELCHELCHVGKITQCPQRTLFYDIKKRTTCFHVSGNRILDKEKTGVRIGKEKNTRYICVEFIRGRKK